MKKIEISGKLHIDKITKANNPNQIIIAVRDCMQDIPDALFETKKQILLLNQIYLEPTHNFLYKKELLREIDKKLTSYKTQDINKNKCIDNNITQEEAIEKIIASKLKCYYCKCNMLIFYNKVRDMEQWTLDRINNNLSHSAKNVVVCCLRCNLQRRCQNKDKFLFTKQLKIVKE